MTDLGLAVFDLGTATLDIHVCPDVVGHPLSSHHQVRAFEVLIPSTTRQRSGHSWSGRAGAWLIYSAQPPEGRS